MANDKPGQTLLVALILCFICSLAVSALAVLLRPAQERNKLLDKQRNILVVAGLVDVTESSNITGAEVTELFANFKAQAIELGSGEKRVDIAVASFDERKASKTPATSMALSATEDIASLKRRENIAIIYELYDGQQKLDAVILPIRGYGLWSTLYGFIALEEDGTTIRGITFYEHAETPGLGGEVDNLKWKASWKGKQAFSETGDVAIRVVKGRAASNTEIDGLAGATITSRGVDNMLQFWLGATGYQTYIVKHLRGG